MQGTRGSSPRRSTNQLSCSSMAEHPADNRNTADRYRAGEPATTGDQHERNDQKTGAAGRRISITDGPGAFKPETVGQRAFNPRARGSTPPGSPNTSSCTRLAQLVERRPLKSEVRGSSPRSCTNSPLACDASAEASPLSAGRDGLDSRAGRQLYQPPSKGGPRCLCPRIQRSCSTPTSGR